MCGAALFAVEDPDALVLTANPLNAVERQHGRVSCQTGPHGRALVLVRPRQNALKAGPIGLLTQIGSDRLPAGDDQRIRIPFCRLFPKLLNVEVKAANSALTGGLSLHLGQRVKCYVDQDVLRSCLEQREKLMLGSAHGTIGHVVDQTNVQIGAARFFECVQLHTRPVET